MPNVGRLNQGKRQYYRTAVALVAICVSGWMCGVHHILPTSLGQWTCSSTGLDALRRFFCWNSNMSSKHITIESRNHRATVIFLHGLGDTGHGWSEAFEAIADPRVKYIFPTANKMAVTLNGGMVMNSWFDIFGLGAGSAEDGAGIMKASDFLKGLVEQEVHSGIPYDKIIVGGFSQGGALALYTGLTLDKKLAGVIALSTWMPLRDQFPDKFKSSKDLRILQCHGTSDFLLPINIAQGSHNLLKALVPSAELKTYPGMQHSSSEQEIQDVKAFISASLQL